MSSFKAFLAIGAIAMASLVVGSATPASADPTGTTFSFITNNFQANTDPAAYDPSVDPLGPGVDSFTPAVPFGVDTFIPAAGVTIGSSVSTSVAAPGLLVGGLDFVEFWIDTYSDGDSGFLNADGGDESAFIISGLDWGSGSPPAVAAGALFIQFDRDGVFETLTTALAPVVPHPVNGASAIVIDITGTPVDTIPLIFGSGPGGLGGALAGLLTAFGVDPFTVSGINGIHIGLEVTHIPEPASFALMGVGLCSTLLMRRRK